MDFKEIIKIIKKRIWVVIALTVVSSTLSAYINYYTLIPLYTSDTSLYVGKQVDNETTLAYNDVMLSTQLVKDYREFIKSRLVTSTVIKELNLTSITLTDLAKKISVTSKNDTRLIQITVIDKNPDTAMIIASKTAEVFKNKVTELMDVENVHIIDEAQIPSTPSGPNKSRNIASTCIIALILSLCLVVALEYFDNTIKTLEDIKSNFNLPVIGVIPILKSNKYNMRVK